MRLLLDEMHAPAVAVALNEAGFDVTATAADPSLRGSSDADLLDLATAADPSLRGSSDADLLDLATAADRALVTENVGDFSVLASARAVAGEPHAGLILTNPARFNRAALAYPGNLIAALRSFLDNPPVSGDSWIRWL